MKQNRVFILAGRMCFIPALAALTFMATFAHAKPKVTEIEVLTSRMGGLAYVMSFGLVDVINKTHPWLRAKGVETHGTTENLKSLALEPERRSKTVIFSLMSSAHQARRGDPPYRKKYTTCTAIALFNRGPLYWVTLNPDLKTPHDLVGKKVGIFPKGSASNMQWLPTVEHGFGIALKDIDWVYTPMGPGLAALADGRLDATWAMSGPPPDYAPAGPLRRLKATKKAYYIGFSPEAFEKAEKASGYPVPGEWVPAGALDPGRPKLYGQVQFLSWWADLGMDEQIVYEITKTIYQNVDKFGTYHVLGKAMTKANIAAIPVSKDLFHPGAARFYKEKGIKIGKK